jgi:Family of unknown function (DUF6338)
LGIIKPEVVQVIQYLIPGLIGAWMFYSLTAHKKSSELERLIEALIFTGFAQLCATLCRWFLLLLGALTWLPKFGTWTPDVEFGWSLLFGLLLGVVAGIASNNDLPYRWLRSCHLTKKTSYPSPWFRAFHEAPDTQWVILHLRTEEVDLQAGLRIQGRVDEFPDDPSEGHFRLSYWCWIPPEANGEVESDEGKEVPQGNVEQLQKFSELTEFMLIPASLVWCVEFLKEQKSPQPEAGIKLITTN